MADDGVPSHLQKFLCSVHVRIKYGFGVSYVEEKSFSPLSLAVLLHFINKCDLYTNNQGVAAGLGTKFQKKKSVSWTHRIHYF